MRPDLTTELRDRTTCEVRFDDGNRALYATDASNYRQVPIGVVVPRTIDDVMETIAVCEKHDVPILSRGGGTSLAGQCCNTAVVMDMRKYLNRIYWVDPEKRLASVQPGVVLDELRDAAERYHLTFAPDPSTHNHCTLGGMIGNNSCGTHSLLDREGSGKVVDQVEELEIVTYDGLRMRVGSTSEAALEKILGEGGRRAEIYTKLRDLRDRYASLIRARYPKIPRRVSGYNLDSLLPENGFNVARALVGTESTCVTVLEATVRLVHSPKARALLVLGYPDIYEAADHVPELLTFQPIALEALDDNLVEDMKKKKLHPEDAQLLPDGKGWLLVELGGATKEEADTKARAIMAKLKLASMKLFTDEKEAQIIWKVRESGLGATARVPGSPDTWEGWEDSAVPPAKLSGYLRDLRALFNKHGYGCALYGHFGQGCVHTRIDFDLVTTDGIRNWRAFMNDATDLVVGYGGSFSGEHGDGQSRAEFLPKMFGPELIRAFEEFKAIWDPRDKMNPGKIVRPFRMDQNLRLGTSYRPWQPVTNFKFPEDDGSLARAALRCVGIGECRKENAGTMCPSYMVTRDEMHSTRGRAHMLFELFRGGALKRKWRNREVREALDLCLSCKGCKGECPMNVDMATYKAEFLSHYYKGRLRPLTAYSMGLIHFWSTFAERIPRLVNFVTQNRFLGGLAKALAGIAPKRTIPKFAPQSFKKWFFRRTPPNPLLPKVILWADTFNNRFFPKTAQAAVEVLEAAGYRVLVPRSNLCCGRPLYDYGFLGLAKKHLLRILEDLGPEIAAGTPVVGLEPSCVTVFRDEMVNLLPTDLHAKRLRQQTFTMAEFLMKKAANFNPPKLSGKAILHGHCHQKAVLKMDCDIALLKAMGLEVEIPDAGCCGMAGSFGFEKNHYDISIAVGERVLLPRVRQTSNSDFILADGFSCREQIEQSAKRQPMHLAELLRHALHAEQLQKPELSDLYKGAA